jgi:hypothetical protein
MIDRFLNIIRAMHEVNPGVNIVVRIMDGQFVNELTLSPQGITEESWVPKHGPISHSGGFVRDGEDAIVVARRVLGSHGGH